jgi:hypothetical protein
MTKKKDPKDLLKTGAPDKFRKEYCKALEQHMAEGLSFRSFAGVVGVCKSTLYNWLNDNPEFLDAKDRGMEKNLFFWEKVGVKGATGQIPNFNATAYVWNKKNRFPEDWNDRRVIEDDRNKIHTVKIELPNQGMQQVISAQPKRIGSKDDAS